MKIARAASAWAAVAAALFIAGTARAEDRSWIGEVVTADGQRLVGQLQFAKGKLILDPGAEGERFFETEAVKNVYYREHNRAADLAAAVAEPEVHRGLFGEYFNGRNHKGAAKSRIDPMVDFNWGTSAPMPEIGQDNFSVRWQGEVRAPITGKVNFIVRSDDGSRLWVDGKQLFSQWTDHAAADFTGTVEVEAGKWYPIKVEYYEGGSDAVAQLFWGGPGLGRAIIPQSHLSCRGKATLEGGRQKIWLRGGSALMGRVIEVDDKWLELGTSYGATKLPMQAVAAIDRTGGSCGPDQLRGRPPGSLMQNGDYHAEDLKSVAEGQVHSFSSLFGKREFAFSNARAFWRGGFTEVPAKLFEIVQRDTGAVLLADGITSKGARLIVRDSSGFYLNVLLADVAEIRAARAP